MRRRSPDPTCDGTRRQWGVEPEVVDTGVAGAPAVELGPLFFHAIDDLE